MMLLVTGEKSSGVVYDNTIQIVINGTLKRATIRKCRWSSTSTANEGTNYFSILALKYVISALQSNATFLSARNIFSLKLFKETLIILRQAP